MDYLPMHCEALKDTVAVLLTNNSYVDGSHDILFLSSTDLHSWTGVVFIYHMN